MLGVGISVEFGARDITVPTKILRELKEFPPSIYDEAEDAIIQRSAERAANIKSKRVRKTTYKIRKKRHDKGIAVPTYVGSEAIPNVSWQVGNRTGTFLKDFSSGSSPGVETILSKDYRVKNGLFIYRIATEEFADEYPVIFEEWLMGKGFLPADGFLDFGEEFESEVAGILERSVLREIERKTKSAKGNK